MADWATSGRIKVERAEKHIRDLETEVLAFKQRCPYTSFVHDDPQTGEWVFRAAIPELPPLRFGAIAGDAIHNLRSSLDILWRILMPGGRHYFPMFPSPQKFERRFGGGKEHGSIKRIVDILKEIKPYKGGNDLLWALHSLDAEDKHHILLPVGSAVLSKTEDLLAPFRQSYLRRTGFPYSGSLFTSHFAKPIYPVNDGTELGRIPINPHGHQMDMNPKFSFDIALGEGETVKGQPIIAVLDQFARMVERILYLFGATGLLPGWSAGPSHGTPRPTGSHPSAT